MLLRYLRWGTQLRLLRIVRRARNDDPDLELEIFRACATSTYPVEESIVRDAVNRDRARGISSFRDLARSVGRTAPGALPRGQLRLNCCVGA